MNGPIFNQQVTRHHCGGPFYCAAAHKCPNLEGLPSLRPTGMHNSFAQSCRACYHPVQCDPTCMPAMGLSACLAHVQTDIRSMDGRGIPGREAFQRAHQRGFSRKELPSTAKERKMHLPGCHRNCIWRSSRRRFSSSLHWQASLTAFWTCCLMACRLNTPAGKFKVQILEVCTGEIEAGRAAVFF